MPSLHEDSSSHSSTTGEITADCDSNKSNSTEWLGSLLPTGVDTMRPVDNDDRLCDHGLNDCAQARRVMTRKPRATPWDTEVADSQALKGNAVNDLASKKVGFQKRRRDKKSQIPNRTN